MSDQTNELFSALLDGELTELEFRRLLKKLGSEDDASDVWERYNKVRGFMHNRPAAELNTPDISGLVMAQVEKIGPLPQTEISEINVSEEQDSGIWKSLTSMAVAATVTAVVILGSQYSHVMNDSSLVADTREVVDIPVFTTPKDFQRTQLLPSESEPVIDSPELTTQKELERGVTRYLTQHKFVQSNLKPHWEVTWLPEGSIRVNEHVFASGSEVVSFASATQEFSVSVEPLGRQSLPTGRIQGNGLVAVGKPVGEVFIAVVGNLEMSDAEKVLSAVVPLRD